MRAEILGAFFNAVFLIALCLSIILEAITRFLDPPEVFNPKLILIVGSLGLASNIVGFFVLGGHGHSHGPSDHSHDDHDHAAHEHAVAHDAVRSAEEGQSVIDPRDENGRAIDVLPNTVVPRLTARNHRRSSSARDKKIKFTRSDETASTSKGSDESVSLGKYGGPSTPKRKRNQGRRSSSITDRLGPDINIHPASFRQEIIQAVRSDSNPPAHADQDSEDALYVDPIEDATEHSPLRGFQVEGHAYQSLRRASVHDNHNHNKPKKAKKGGHGHSHGDLGMNGMILHVIGDALGNVGVIVSALIIWLTHSPQRFYADPAVSLFITLIILRSAIPLTSATAKILLQATPDHLDVNDIKEDIQSIPGIVSCHHVHIWQLSDSQIVASMHVQVAFGISSPDGAERYMSVAKAVRKCLHAYGIHSATIQPEFCTDGGHDHVQLDGPNGGAKTDADSCLLECVDDCAAASCCVSSKSPPPTIGSPGGHDHGSHDHSHPHSHDDHGNVTGHAHHH